MGLTKDQWYSRLTSWVPGWVFEQDDGANVAIFKGMAQLLALIDAERAEIILETFIDSANTPYLELHGDERTVEKLSGESDASYRLRIKTKNISSKCSLPEIELIVDEALTVDARVEEDFSYGVFCDTGSYCDNADILFDWIENGGFSVIIEAGADADEVAAMIDSINSNKVFGVLYRVVERF